MKPEFEERLAELIVEAQTRMRPDVRRAIEAWLERNPRLEVLLENAEIARQENRPLCQDTGLVEVFLELPAGWPVPADFAESVNRAVARAYQSNGFRFSTVFPPLGERRNRGDNTPGFVHLRAVDRAAARLKVMIKGAGSENVSFVEMLLPGTSEDELVDLIVRKLAPRAASACPPLVLGVGLGGNLTEASLAARKQLFEPLGSPAGLGARIAAALNAAGAGPFGLGGEPTVLDVKVAQLPAHIASLPLAVIVSCHALRTAEAEITESEWGEWWS